MTQLNAIGAALADGPLEQKWFDAWYETPEEAQAAKQHHDVSHSSTLTKVSANLDSEFERMDRMARGR